MTLAEKIYQARRRAGLSQEALADALGVTRQAVSKWETGKSVPDTENIRALAAALAVTADYFLGDIAGALGDIPSGAAPPERPDTLPEKLGLILFLAGVAAIAVCSVVFLLRSLLGEGRVYATIQVTDFTIAAVMFLLSLAGGSMAFLLTRNRK